MQMIKNAIVKVVIPADRSLICLIHRTIEFVIRDGPLFEEMLIEQEAGNPAFSFLYDFLSVGHIYYRWKLFSILQGDSPYNWRTETFRMFKDGSLWQPPPSNIFTKGMPEQFYIENATEEQLLHGIEGQLLANSKLRRISLLSTAQRQELVQMLENLTLSRKAVGKVMFWCVEHCELAEDIVDVIVESFGDPEMSMPKKIARLYLLSDILSNCTAKVQHVSLYRKFIGNRLGQVFYHLHVAYKLISGRLRAEQVRQRVNSCLRVWEDMVIYPYDFVFHLSNIFLGLASHEESEGEKKDDEREHLDGQPLPVGDYDDHDLDGMPIGDASERKLDDISTGLSSSTRGGFVRSKWEKVEPDRIEEQAMTSSKWEQLAASARDEHDESDEDEDIDGVPIEESVVADQNVCQGPLRQVQQKEELSDERRQLLREVEVKVMQYQDELESGLISRQKGLSIAEQVDRRREQLLNEVERAAGNSDDNSNGSSGGRQGVDSVHSLQRRHREREDAGRRQRYADENRSRQRADDLVKRKRSRSRSRSSKQSRRETSRSSKRYRSPRRR